MKNDLEDRIILKGYIENPYPWIKEADMLACVSYAEGYSNVCSLFCFFLILIFILEFFIYPLIIYPPNRPIKLNRSVISVFFWLFSNFFYISNGKTNVGNLWIA